VCVCVCVRACPSAISSGIQYLWLGNIYELKDLAPSKRLQHWRTAHIWLRHTAGKLWLCFGLVCTVLRTSLRGCANAAACRF
jgi:hypothetical protein